MKSGKQEDKYTKAKQKVEAIKGFYSHLVVYVLVNIVLLLIHMGVFTNSFISIVTPGWAAFTTPVFWGIAILFHGLYVFKFQNGFFKNWEERKIKEYMEKEEKAVSRNFKE
ncbi:MAG: 2TM domain-containing protein [Flavobacteriales bacterium]|jgi:hypothetical protein|uniref:2TM domain-containing protein n=1 Tax=Candidatus Ulvibacter alkanivorans TaxID=2267620 RepID=UPI000DF3FA1D|nr:2TM domain-containing protein [Candidatus Ulvibacter alkanivorans]MCH2488768.1 2TM domain-containing protein [Flavobacteriales bacterium]